MITKENFREVIQNLPAREKDRIMKTDKEYLVIKMTVFNAGYTLNCHLTNDYDIYKNVSSQGNCILSVQEVVEILNEPAEKVNEFSISMVVYHPQNKYSLEEIDSMFTKWAESKGLYVGGSIKPLDENL